MNQNRIKELVALQQERAAKLSNLKTVPVDFRVENKAATKTSTIYLYDEIAPWAITAKDFVAELNQIPDNHDIELRINSGGGGVFDGLAIYNAMKKRKAKTKSYVDGVAASAASFIAMAGSEVVFNRNSTMMIHDASGLAIGNARDMRELADLLDMLSDQIADIYVQKAGGTKAEWRDLMSTDKWFTAQEAKDRGLADTVLDEDGNPPSDAFDPSELLSLFTTLTSPPSNTAPDALPTIAQEFDLNGLRDALKGVFQ
jgi:ATP-dependent Clp endopeptidase proteolytic subunit ClpP